MNWHTFFYCVWAAQTVSTLFAMYHHFKALECLKKENKIWGDCCYTCGYLDGKRGNKPELKSKKQMLAEMEKENANQTI